MKRPRDEAGPGPVRASYACWRRDYVPILRPRQGPQHIIAADMAGAERIAERKVRFMMIRHTF